MHSGFIGNRSDVYGGTVALVGATFAISHSDFGVSEKTIITCGSDIRGFNTIKWRAAWKSFHGGVLARCRKRVRPGDYWLGDRRLASGHGRRHPADVQQGRPGPESGSTFNENTTIEIRIAPE